MQQKYAVYLNRKALLFNNSQYIQAQGDSISFFEGNSPITIQQAFKWLCESENENSIAIFKDLTGEKGIELLKNEFKCIIAAGGIVANSDGKLLFIERLGLWDLPKGKVEKGESIELAAQREIIEETGIDSLTNQEFLCKTYHIYLLKEKFVLKESVWFSFKSNYSQKLIPQLAEHITKAVWIDLADVSTILLNTYPSIVQVLDRYLRD
jgi:8-oxo-dGTP pyrophosphatase MutT (NUDIX family)